LGQFAVGWVFDFVHNIRLYMSLAYIQRTPLVMGLYSPRHG
jgi:hypothetical protein